jgi:predicted dithiol-disulfide oxidoreductase (DUF899 family)
MGRYRFPNESDGYRARRDELVELEKDLRARIEAVAQKRRELPPGGRLKEDYRFERVRDDGGLHEVPFEKLYSGREKASDPSSITMMNVFHKSADGIFHTWGSELVSHPMPDGSPRHVDMVWPYWNLLDMTPEGRGDRPVPIQNFEHAYFSRRFLAAGG